MITRIVIRNFQKYKSYKLKLDRFVTTIVGPSDIGKSAILRALQWVALNKPRGNSFIRAGEEQASVTLRVDKRTITRTRGKHNTYTLDQERFAAFGNDVPTEISNLLNLSELNFQGQHDPAFWFSNSPGEVSKQLNQIVDLSVMDTTLAYLKSHLRRTIVEARVITERLAEAELERSRLKKTRKADKHLKQVEALQHEALHAAIQAVALRSIVEQATTLQETAKRLAQAGSEAITIADLGETWRSQWERRSKLSYLALQGDVYHQEAKVKLPDFTSLDKKKDKWIGANIVIDSLQRTMEQVYGLRTSIIRLKSEAIDMTNTIFEMIGEVCPLCDQTIQ